MEPTLDWLRHAEHVIHKVLIKLQPVLLEAQGNIEHHLKDDKSVVTEMDLLVERELEKALISFDKGVKVCGEEMGADYSLPTYWLIDPIDGTDAFIRGMPFATTMLSLIHNDEAQLGIIYNFATNDHFVAFKGQGASCNGHPIHVSDRGLERATIVVSSNIKKSEAVFGLNERLRRDLMLQNVVKFAASGYEHSQVACGALEARVAFYTSAQPWDHAPGVLLITEAGGKATNIGSSSKQFDFKDMQYVAANPVIFDQLMTFMNDVAKEKA